MYHFATCLHSSNCGHTDNTYSLQIWRDNFFWIKTQEGSLRSGLGSHRLGASTLEAFDQGVHPTGIPEFRSYRRSTSCRQPFMLAPFWRCENCALEKIQWPAHTIQSAQPGSKWWWTQDLNSDLSHLFMLSLWIYWRQPGSWSKTQQQTTLDSYQNHALQLRDM